jgi:hypothetical protein
MAARCGIAIPPFRPVSSRSTNGLDLAAVDTSDWSALPWSSNLQRKMAETEKKQFFVKPQ